MKTKTAKLLVIIFVITLCMSFGTVALADESISTSVRVNPPSLPGPGTVSVVVTIKNDGDPISNVKLKYPSPTDTEVTIGDIGTGETKEHVNESWNITEEMFGKELAFTVTWTSLDGSVKSGQTPAVVIEQKDETVDVVGEASADPTEIKAGDRVKFKFSMSNKGNVSVENAYLNAPPIEDGNQIGSNFTLEPGATKNMEYTITVNESMTVNPVFTYSVNGTQQTLNLNAVSVNVDQPANVTMNMTLAASQSITAQGGDVEFTATVSNTGNSQLDGLQVMDFNGTPITMSTTTLQPGGEATGSVTLPISQTGNYSFTATAVGAGGQTLNIQSNNVAITLEGDEAPPPEEPTDQGAQGAIDAGTIIRTDISLSTTQLAKPGEVDMIVNVSNLTAEPLTNIVVMDAIIGTIGTAASLPAGESTTFEYSFTAEETAAYEFVTSAQLPDGTPVESSVGTTITVDNKGGGLESWKLGIIIVGAAIAAIVIILVVYMRRVRNNRGNQRQQRRPNPQDGEQRYSPNGRMRPQRYANGRYEPDYDRRPERPSSAQQKEYQKNRASRVETIDPNKARASYAEQRRKEPAAKNPPQSRQPRGNQSSSAKFGDRNKF